jgi:ribosome-associated translation inhibitor RaiA
MSIPLQITMSTMPRSDALDARIRRDVAKLERIQARIAGCRVALERIGAHHREGGRFRARVELRVPGRPDIVASLDPHEDVHVALRDAFTAAQRQLTEVVREMRRPPRDNGSPARKADDGDKG